LRLRTRLRTIKNLTAEIAEHAEIKMAKSSMLREDGGKGPQFPTLPGSPKSAKAFSGRGLCALRILLSYLPLLSAEDKEKGRVSFSKMKEQV